jgi:hypothetical protein
MNVQRLYLRPDLYTLRVLYTTRTINFVGYRRPVCTEHTFSLARDFLINTEVRERAGCCAFPLQEEPEKEVFGADVIVAETHGLLLSEHHDHGRPLGKSFEHRRSLLSERSNGWSV